MEAENKAMSISVLERSRMAADQALQVAGRHDNNWNRKFLLALEHLGFELLTVPKSYEGHPEDPIWAPAPSKLSDPYPYPSFIVPKGWRSLMGGFND